MRLADDFVITWSERVSTELGNIRFTRPLAGGMSRKNIETPLTHQNHSYFPFSCEEGLPSGMFLFGGMLTTFLDFGLTRLFPLSIYTKK